jgi:tRNA dimethylallyltransferase
MRKSFKKAIVIVGATASGKTACGVFLAQAFDGEIVSADSRQVYRGMDIGTNKECDLPIAQHCIDIKNPDESYTLSDYQRDARAAMEDIWERGKLPIIVGGTGLYIAALVDNFAIPNVPPNDALRRALEKKSAAELFLELEQRDPNTAAIIEQDNPRRLIRALEFVHATGQSFAVAQKKNKPFFEALQIGIRVPRDELYRRIDERVLAMMDAGLEEEARALIAMYDAALPAMSGIGYGEMAAFIRGACSRKEAVAQIQKRTRNYARRQISWFKRDNRIRWVENAEEAIEHAQDFSR